MKKLFFLVVSIILLIPLPCHADENIIGTIGGREDIMLVKDGWKHGLKKTNGTVIAPCEYEEILPIEGSSSHFLLSLGGKYGVVDEYGSMLLPVKYSYIVPKLFGNKLLIQQKGDKISESAVSDLSIPADDIYNLHYGSGETEVTARYMEMTPLKWMPYDRRFAINGQWGLADIRPNVSMIFPSYSMVSVCPDNDRYLLMGYTFGTVSAYNIYDTKNETFILSMEKNVQYSSILLLQGGYFLVNGLLRKYEAPENNINSSALSFIADLNENYFLCKSKKDVVMINKQNGKVVAEDKDITHYVTNVNSNDFLLKENGSWILYSDGHRYTDFGGDLCFMGGYPVELKENNACVVIDGKPTHKAGINFFSVDKDGKSIIYVNDDEELVILEYPGTTEKVLHRDCSGFQTYYSNQDYVMIKANNDKSGLMNIRTGEMVVPLEYKGVKPLYGDYYITIGDTNFLRRFSAPDFMLECKGLSYNDYTHTPFCWISETGEPDSFALFSMERDSLLTGFNYTGVEMTKYPGRTMMLGDDFIPFIAQDKKGIMNTDGQEIFPASFDQLLFVFTEGFCVVTNDNLFGSVNPYTKAVLPSVFDNLGRYINGKCAVKKDGLWGIADTNGEMLVPNRYKSVADYFEDLDWLRKEHFSNGLTYGVLDDSATPATVEWFDNNGNILCSGTAATPLVQTVIPEGLWDY